MSSPRIDEFSLESDEKLHDAVTKYNVEEVKQLLKNKANVDALNEFKETPLVALTRAYYMDAVLSDLNSQQCDNSHLLAIQDIVALLLKQKANLNATRFIGDAAPLHFMSRDSTLPIAQLLIRYGANTFLKDRHGDTAEGYAKECKQYRAVQYLQTGTLETAVRQINSKHSVKKHSHYQQDGIKQLIKGEYEAASNHFKSAIDIEENDADKKSALYCYRGTALLASILSPDFNHDERELCKKNIEVAFEEAKALADTPFLAISNGLAILSDFDQMIINARDKLGSERYLKKILIKFELTMLMKIHIRDELVNYDLKKGFARRARGDSDYVMKIRAVIESGDALFLSEENLLQLYKIHARYKIKPSTLSFSIYSAMDKRLFGAGNNLVLSGILKNLSNSSMLTLNAILSVRELLGENKDTIGKLIANFDQTKILTSNILNDLTSIIIAPLGRITNVKKIMLQLSRSGLLTKEILKNFYDFVLQSGAPLNSAQYLNLISEIEKSFEAKDLSSIIDLIACNLDLILMLENSDADQRAGIMILVQEAKDELGIANFKYLIEAALFENKFVNHFPSLVSLAIQFGKKGINELIKAIHSENTWASLNYKTNDILYAQQQIKFPEKSLDVVGEGFKNKGTDVEFPLRSDEVDQLIEQYKLIVEHEKTLLVKKNMPTILKNCVADLKINPTDIHNKCLLLAIIRQHIKYEFGLFPYNVQMLNVLAFLNDPDNRRIAQIKTGEGKSTIIAMITAYWAISGYAVDVITTSRDLAIRDSKKFTKFYESLGLSVGHNAKDTRAKSDYYRHIIYGIAYDFEFAYLQEETEFEPIRDQRKYQVAIVDEVDSMFIDMQSNAARWSTSLKETTSTYIFERMWDYISNNSWVSLSDFSQNFSYYGLTTKKIKRYYDSALSAKRKELNKDYVIMSYQRKVYDPYSHQVEMREYKKIEPVDYKNTGQVNTGCRWGNGLHSMLEAKHGLPLQEESALVGTISHIDYFNKYQILLGVTGTVGTQSDREELKKLYKVSCYDSPSYRPSLKKSDKHLVCHLGFDPEKHKAILAVVFNMVKLGRPVLIICETIKNSQDIYNLLKLTISNVQLYNAIQSESADTIVALAGNPGMVTVATNTAGRGADISPTPLADKNGGLHVIVTFKTLNKRVEEQAFGRTGRQGRVGTYQYILSLSDFRGCIGYDKMSEDIIGDWQTIRDINSQALSEQRLFFRELSYLVYRVQMVFFSLPVYAKKKHKPQWALMLTEIDELVRNVNFSSHAESSDQVKKNICELLLEFWNQNKVYDSWKTKNRTLLHHLVSQKEKELIQLCLKFFSGLDRVKDSDNFTAFDAAKKDPELLCLFPGYVVPLANHPGTLFANKTVSAVNEIEEEKSNRLAHF